MRQNRTIAAAAAILVAAGTSGAGADVIASTIVCETELEFVTSGDIDGDGRLDLVIVDRPTGRLRVGYQIADGIFDWADYLDSGVKDATGVTIGPLFSEKKSSVAVTSADGNAIALVEIAGRNQPGQVINVPPPGLGPNSIVALDIGGAGNTPLLDLFISTTYNTPDPNKGTLFRNGGVAFAKLADQPLTGAVTKANRLALKAGGPELLCFMLAGDAGDTFRADNLASGQPQTVLLVTGLPSGTEYVAGFFRGGALRDLLFYQPGEKKFTCRPLAEAGAQLQAGEAKDFELEAPIRALFAVPAEGGDKLVAIYGTNDVGAVFTFDGTKPPVQIQKLQGDEKESLLLSTVLAFPKGFLALLAPSTGKIRYSTHYQQFSVTATACSTGARGRLPSLADRDDITVPAIHKMILAKLTEKTEADMKPYTNVIPGTQVKYVMVPIPGGEFEMGSPLTEKNRKEDEGPVHKVKIEPFWMGAFEVGWNEYELFMYPDEERKFKDTIPTDPEVDKISDAVTRPSKPYVEMSFGMGKDGYPAIAMTQHAANKYCHWLSAKTGHYYRLPTEAEWEYAARAGTKTAYFFGDDPAKLGDYAWYDENSDFKYQKMGKKKPNPWGLYDIYGNILEWCLDGYDPGFYAKCAAQGVVTSPWNRPTQPYPHVVRGGSWDDPADTARSAARRGSDRSWKATDPQLPKSIWWFSDIKTVGFRLVRPLKVPPPEELVKVWISGTEKD